MNCRSLRISLALGVLTGVCGPGPARAQSTASAPLHALNAAIAELTAKVSPSVVQVLVTGYRVVNSGDPDGSIVIGKVHGTGAGAIVDADGYIVTNAHVVEGAERIRIVLHAPAAGASPLKALAEDQGLAIPATVVGVARDVDLAVLKIERQGLTPIPFADYNAARQGELVFAFGSPEGLRDSVSMGVISTTARQPTPDSPSVFIQTDAPINPGNSGGPLVNIRGELVGLNTFILSQSGGSHGLGFAVPSTIVAATYRQLRTYGHPNRGSIGIQVQAITPALAEGLHLERMSGVIVADVAPHSAADLAGVSVRDVVLAINGHPIDSVPLLTLAATSLQPGDRVDLELLRGTQKVVAPLVVGEDPNTLDRLSDLGDPRQHAVPALGIIGIDVTDRVRTLLPNLRVPDGVLVTARRQGTGLDNPIMAGDIIHGLNTHAVSSLAGLQVLTEHLDTHSEVVLQIERNGRRQFLVVTVP